MKTKQKALWFLAFLVASGVLTSSAHALEYDPLTTATEQAVTLAEHLIVGGLVFTALKLLLRVITKAANSID